MALNMNRSISIVRNKNTMLGCKYNSRSYVIGFQNNFHGEMVRRIVDDSSTDNIMLMRYLIEDISQDVNYGLRKFGMNKSVENITIDVMATLIIPKSKRKDMNLEIEKIDIGDFMMFPLAKQIGVIIPMDILEDSEKSIVFQSQVVDPIDDVELFLQNMSV